MCNYVFFFKSSIRSTDHKVKIMNSNAITSQAIQSTQRQVGFVTIVNIWCLMIVKNEFYLFYLCDTLQVLSIEWYGHFDQWSCIQENSHFIRKFNSNLNESFVIEVLFIIETHSKCQIGNQLMRFKVTCDGMIRPKWQGNWISNDYFF